MVLLAAGGEVAASQSQVRSRFSGNLNMLLHIERMHGRSAADISKELGIRPTLLSKWRSGIAYPRTPEQIDELAKVLGVDVAVFLKGTGVSPESSLKESLERAVEELGGRAVWSGKT